MRPKSAAGALAHTQPGLRYRALASDYDGTLAEGGRVAPPALDALRRLQAGGWRVVLVTGRRLEDLLGVFTDVGLCDRVVAENGGVLYRPDDGSVETLGPAPSPTLIASLRRRGVRFEVGRVAIFTFVEFESQVRQAVLESGSDVTFSLNKGALMVPPAGVDKASGLLAALPELGVAADEVVGVGDAENDAPFLSVCGLSVAVANALPVLRQHADLVTTVADGQGVRELVERLLNPDGTSAPGKRDI